MSIVAAVQVEDRTRIADTNNLRDIVINVRDETIARVDDMCDRSFAQVRGDGSCSTCNRDAWGSRLPFPASCHAMLRHGPDPLTRRDPAVCSVKNWTKR